MAVESYDFLQGEESIAGQLAAEDDARRNQQPKAGQTPSLTTTSLTNADGSNFASVTVTWSQSRKDMDYIIRWKKSTDSNYTYERSKSSPHVIRPVESGVTINVGLGQERRQTGARGQFGTDASISTPGDTTAPSAPSGLTCSANAAIGTISLTWTASIPGDFDYFQVSRSTAAGASGEFARVLGTVFEDVNAKPGTTYFYRVKAFDRTGNQSDYSNETSCTVTFLGTLSVAPNKTSVTAVTGSFTTAITQRVFIPPGSQKLQLYTNIISSTLTAGAQIQVRFSVGSSGSNISNTQAITFNMGGQQQAVQLTSNAALNVSGETSIIYEWLAVGTISAQLTSTGAVEVIAA